MRGTEQLQGARRVVGETEYIGERRCRGALRIHSSWIDGPTMNHPFSDR